MIEEARARIAGGEDGAEEGTAEEKQVKKLSRGASIMLERTVTWLEGYNGDQRKVEGGVA